MKLAALGPRLAALAVEMNAQAKAQAASAAATAASLLQLSLALERGVGELRGASDAVKASLATVARIAEQTKLLSINASIEAARSGEQGRAFAVVASEIQRLAQDTGGTTRLIEERMGEMHRSVSRVEAVGGTGNADAAGENLGTTNRGMEQLTASATRQLDNARGIDTCGQEVNQETESLLLAIGTFRFEAHARAEQTVGGLVPELSELMADRARMEPTLIRWLGAHDYFELVYVTDARGTQFVDNIGWAENRVTRDPAGFGRDWSERKWFREALARDGVSSTDIYRSAATGDFCFTVSAAVRNSSGKLQGVIGTDVNFKRLLQR